MNRLPFALAALLVAGACGTQSGVPPERALPALEAGTVELRDVELTISTEAVVEAVRQSTVSAQVTGRIVDIRFDVGDRVEKGAVIVRIDESSATQALAASVANVREAEATLANARANLERSRQLFAQKFVSQAALDKAETEFKAAESRMRAMLAGAGQAATERGFATVVAPYGGVVSARHVQLGEMATPGKPLMSGFDPASLRVVATVPATQAQAIRSTTRARIEIPSTGRWVEAKSVTVSPSIEARTHATQVRIELPPVAGIHPGAFARAHFVVGSAPRLMVPREAVFQRSEVTGVYVIDERGAAQLRQVRLGDARDERTVEVLAGLDRGERVALDPVKAAMASAPRA